MFFPIFLLFCCWQRNNPLGYQHYLLTHQAHLLFSHRFCAHFHAAAVAKGKQHCVFPSERCPCLRWACPSERPAPLQWREAALRLWTRLCQRPSLPGRACSSLESNVKGSQASDWAVSGLLAASTSKGLSSAVIMNSKSRLFGPWGKIQRFLLRVWFIPLTLLGTSFSVLFQAKFPLSSTGDWADSTTWIFGR